MLRCVVLFVLLFVHSHVLAKDCTPVMSAEQAFLSIKQPASSTNSPTVTISQSNAVVLPTSNLININTATEAQLAQLKGIGARKAQDIILYREMIAPFQSVDDLAKVKGIGMATVDKNRHLLTVSP